MWLISARSSLFNRHEDRLPNKIPPDNKLCTKHQSAKGCKTFFLTTIKPDTPSPHPQSKRQIHSAESFWRSSALRSPKIPSVWVCKRVRCRGNPSHQHLGGLARDSSDLSEGWDRFGSSQIEQPLEKVLMEVETSLKRLDSHGYLCIADGSFGFLRVFSWIAEDLLVAEIDGSLRSCCWAKSQRSRNGFIESVFETDPLNNFSQRGSLRDVFLRNSFFDLFLNHCSQRKS